MNENQDSLTDHEAGLRLYTKFEGNFRAFAASLLPTWEGVDEVMQESSVVLWRKLSQFDQSAEDGFLDWAFMIARYEALKYRRRRATDRLQFSEDMFELLASEAARTCATRVERPLALRECVKEPASKQLTIVRAVYEDGAAVMSSKTETREP